MTASFVKWWKQNKTKNKSKTESNSKILILISTLICYAKIYTIYKYRANISVLICNNCISTSLLSCCLIVKLIHFFRCLYQLLLEWEYYFFICYLATPWPTVGYYWENSLTHLMLISMFDQFLSQSTGSLGSLSMFESLVGFELGTLRFDFNSLGHFPWIRLRNISKFLK